MDDARQPGHQAPDAAQVHRRLIDAYPDILAGRLEEPLTLIDADVVDHRGGTSGDHHGREAWRRKWEQAAEPGAFRDVSVTVEQTVATDEVSVNRYTSRGVEAATGRRYEVVSMDMIKVRDGRVTEHWALRDTDAIRDQLASGSG